MLWHILKYHLCLVIATYFKRTQIKNQKNLRVKGPVVIAMNHPNAFMDPVAFSTITYPPRVRYLARGDAFKKGIVTAMLKGLGIIPIFRIQDGGKEGLKKNDESYDYVNSLLRRNKKIIIFAEGICIQERRLRPLKKGVPRMIFGAMEDPKLHNLVVVPVGMNYTDPSQFQGTVFCNIGEPIRMSDYLEAYKAAPAKTMNQFLADLAPRMKELIVHIDHKHTEAVIAHLEEIYRSVYFRREKLNDKDLEHDLQFSKALVAVINRAEQSQPEAVAALGEKSRRYMSSLKKLNIKDWLIDPAAQNQISAPILWARILCLVLSFPVYVRGLIGNYPPYLLTDKLVNKKVRAVEFKSSFRMGIGGFMVLLYYILQFFVVKALAPNPWWAVLALFTSFLSGWFCLKLSPFRKKTWGIYRVLKLKKENPALLEELSAQRREIIAGFEALSSELPADTAEATHSI